MGEKRERNSEEVALLPRSYTSLARKEEQLDTEKM